jgi:hypothetical protein
MMAVFKNNRAVLSIAVLFSIGTGASAFANLIITPTFDSSITGDANALAIEGVIYSTIGVYEAMFTDPIDVSIKFQAMTSGLGQSSTTLYTMSYSTFIAALRADATTADDATAKAHLPANATNPVNGTSSINVKTANLKALGFSGSSFPPIGGFDGVIGVNTTITDIGSPGTSGQYSLQATLEHEIDEVLGLGSDVSTSLSANPSVEDLFRYDASGARSYTTDTSKRAFFSLDGTTDLAEFNNQNFSGDSGDWRSDPLPSGVQAQVQDAFATPGAHPALGVELRALDAVGYDLVAPEPGTIFFSGAAFLILGGFARRRVQRGR